MDLIYHHLQTADITLNMQDTVRIVRLQLTEADACAVLGSLYALEKKLTPPSHCIIHTLQTFMIPRRGILLISVIL